MYENLTVRMWPTAITLKECHLDLRNDIRQIIYIYHEKLQLNTLVWGSLTLAQLEVFVKTHPALFCAIIVWIKVALKCKWYHVWFHVSCLGEANWIHSLLSAPTSIFRFSLFSKSPSMDHTPGHGPIIFCASLVPRPCTFERAGLCTCATWLSKLPKYGQPAGICPSHQQQPLHSSVVSGDGGP